MIFKYIQEVDLACIGSLLLSFNHDYLQFLQTHVLLLTWASSDYDPYIKRIGERSLDPPTRVSFENSVVTTQN